MGVRRVEIKFVLDILNLRHLLSIRVKKPWRTGSPISGLQREERKWGSGEVELLRGAGRV